MKKWEHNELAEDLADIKGTGFLDVPLGSVFLNNGTQRADVIEIKPSYTRFCVTIYEVKVSRGDFLNDIRTEKYKGYLEHCHRFYFAVPAGMISKDEVPIGAGLIVRGERGWSTIKRAKVMDNKIPTETLLSLLFSKEREYFRDRKRYRVYEASSWSSKKKYYSALGKRVGEALRKYDEADSAKKHYESLINMVREDICEGLGVKYNPNAWDSPEWELAKLVREIKEKAE